MSGIAHVKPCLGHPRGTVRYGITQFVFCRSLLCFISAYSILLTHNSHARNRQPTSQASRALIIDKTLRPRETVALTPVIVLLQQKYRGYYLKKKKSVYERSSFFFFFLNAYSPFKTIFLSFRRCILNYGSSFSEGNGLGLIRSRISGKPLLSLSIDGSSGSVSLLCIDGRVSLCAICGCSY